MAGDDFVPRPEWELYCRSVNGELKEIKAAQLLTNKALNDIYKCISNRWSRGQVAITAFLATTTGSLLAILLTHLVSRR